MADSETLTAESDAVAVDADDGDPRRTRVARSALALGSGALVALSMPPWGFWPLAIVGVMLFGLALGGATGSRDRITIGFLFGAGWMYLGMGWMVQLTIPGYLVAGTAFAGIHAAAAWLAPVGAWRILGRPAAHSLVEAIRFSFPFGGIPLASLGISQVAGPLGGIARIGGVVLITWVVFQLGFGLAELLRAAADRSRPGADVWPLGLSGLAVVLAVIVLAVVAPTGSSTGETMRIAAVQGGGEQGTTADDVPSIIVTERHLAATATIAPDPELGLVLWPENTIDVVEFEGSEIHAAVTAEAQRLGVPLAVGVTEDDRTDPSRFTNAQVVVAPDGEIVSRYDKVRRVPFGEYVPLRSLLEIVTNEVDRVGDARAGTEPAILDVPVAGGDDVRFATVISWEVFFGGRAREGVELGGRAILNPTNGASYTGTIVQTQQIASSRLRAIETGRWVVQVAPTGFSAFIDDEGTVVERTAQREQAVIVNDVELRTGSTWYVSLGDRPFVAALIVLVIVTLWRGARFPDLARRF